MEGLKLRQAGRVKTAKRRRLGLDAAGMARPLLLVIAAPDLPHKVPDQGDVGRAACREVFHANLTRAADAAPFPDKRKSTEQIGLNVEFVEPVYVLLIDVAG
jgi:hypothetical protein